MANSKKYIPLNDSDDHNPDYMFSLFPKEILIGIIEGSIDAKKYAKLQLKNRGLDLKGKWVGFQK